MSRNAQAALMILLLAVLATSRQARGAESFSLLASPGGITGTLVGSDYVNSFGTMNALGLGTPQTGLTVTVLGNGALYFSEYQVQFSGVPAGHKAGLTTYISTNFNHPGAQVMENCPDTAACNGSGGYSAMSTSAAAPSAVVPAPGIGNATVTAGLGIFLPDNDGATAYTGADGAAVVTFTMTDLTSNTVVATATFTLNGAPANTVQDAVQFTLGTAPGGLTVTTASDFSMNFGNVNGLGIGPAAGLSTVAAGGGIIYSTPYLINTAFTDFSSTTGHVSVYASTNFAHPAILKLEDAASAGGPYAVISLTSAGATSITAAAGDRASITRHLGLFVANTNGPTSFTGTDNATLTFTLTVP